jgi:hypothetical protein
MKQRAKISETSIFNFLPPEEQKNTTLIPVNLWKRVKRHTRTGFFKHTVHKPTTSVADPEPYVFGPPISFYHQAKIVSFVM